MIELNTLSAPDYENLHFAFMLQVEDERSHKYYDNASHPLIRIDIGFNLKNLNAIIIELIE